MASGDNGSGLNFSGLGLVNSAWDWPATPATAGPMNLVWTATAPHNPSFFKIWITKAGCDHKTHLASDKMAFLGRYDIDSDVTKVGNEYRMTATLPARGGRHVLYVAW